LGKTVRRILGVALIVTGVIGLLLPIIPGIPLLLAGAALVGPDHPWIRPLVARLRVWRQETTTHQR
jgi:uncharacterized protein YqgC (DUF456 family)